MHWKETRIPLRPLRIYFADGSFCRGTFEINNWVMGLLKKGAMCPVSLLPWCAFVLRECEVMVWWPPSPAMWCGRGHAVTVTLLHKICMPYQKRQNVKLVLAGYLLNLKNGFRVKTKASFC